MIEQHALPLKTVYQVIFPVVSQKPVLSEFHLVENVHVHFLQYLLYDSYYTSHLIPFISDVARYTHSKTQELSPSLFFNQLIIDVLFILIALSLIYCNNFQKSLRSRIEGNSRRHLQSSNIRIKY